MTHSVVDNRFRSVKSRLRVSSVISMALLPLLVACAGDLDPKFGQGGSSGGGTGGMTGTGGSGTGTGGAGTTGTGGAGVGGAAAGCDAVGTIFVPKCTSSCHMPGSAFGLTLDLSTDAAAAKAINGTQSYPCVADKTSKIINPTGPVSGSLLLYVAGDTCGPGTQMPLGMPPLTAAEIDCVKSYYMAKLK